MHIHIHKGKETSTLVLDFPLDFNEGLLLRLCFSALHVGMDPFYLKKISEEKVSFSFSID